MVAIEAGSDDVGRFGGGDFGATPGVWHNGPLSSPASGPSHPDWRGTAERDPPGPTRTGVLTHTQVPRRQHKRGRQDPTEAYGQDPYAVLPRRRRRLPQEARRTRH